MHVTLVMIANNYVITADIFSWGLIVPFVKCLVLRVSERARKEVTAIDSNQLEA